ncbi:MAG: hypothetical protein R2857_15940 [Vampirovibrionales bacterium]
MALDRATNIKQDNALPWLENLWRQSYTGFHTRFDRWEEELNEAKAILGNHEVSIGDDPANTFTLADANGDARKVTTEELAENGVVWIDGQNLGNATLELLKSKIDLTKNSYANSSIGVVLQGFFDDNPTAKIAIFGKLISAALYSWTPLVVDMNNDGLQLTKDLTVNRNGRQTSWVASGSDDVFIVSVGKDGKVTLMGEETASSDADNGFTNLADYDSNGDGKFDANDSAYRDGRVQTWHDDGDGIVEFGELQTLNQRGITAIDLGFGKQDMTVNFNLVPFRSTVTMFDGSNRNIYDVLFNSSN